MEGGRLITVRYSRRQAQEVELKKKRTKDPSLASYMDRRLDSYRS